MQRSPAGNGALNGGSHGCWRAHPDELLPMRTTVRGWLAEFALGPEAEQDLVLAVNEAATNAVEHAYRDSPVTSGDNEFEVSLRPEPGWLSVAITDRGMWQQRRDTDGERFGILIMHQLMASVTIDKNDKGTRVLLRYPLLAGE